MNRLSVYLSIAAGLAIAGFICPPVFAQPAPDSFMGMGLDGVTYWSSTPFANTFMTGSNWNEVSSNGTSTRVYTWDNPQFDQSTLLPKYLNNGTFLRTHVFPMNANYYNRPSNWPLRSGPALGRVLVTWTGNADVRLTAGTYVASESNGSSTGLILNGRRMYQINGPTASLSVEVRGVDASNPPTSLRVWLPNPSNPNTSTLEGQFWHPLFLARLNDMPLRFIRFMDWGATNGSPQMNWSDRRLPSHAMQTGTLNRREPAVGFSGNRPTGVAYEYMVRLANEIGTDLWVCIPHLADDTYIRKLARLIRYGSDGVEPYNAPVASPVYPPLRADLKVWVEFSNEIWSNGPSFPQGNWAEQQGAAQGLSKARFNARQFCRAWRIFQEEFGGTSRLVRVAALFTASNSYNQDFLSEIASYGPTLSPPVAPDVASPTTYFGNGIQDWAHQKAMIQAGSADPWFYTTETFVTGNVTRPVTIPMTSSYWNSSAIARHLTETFTEWKRRIFSGSNLQGGGPDATAVGGGFDASISTTIQSALGHSLPLVSYEGGPSLYTDDMDWGDTRDDGITAFVEALNRDVGMEEIFRIQLNMAFSKGLRHHGVFVGPSGSWGKYGQWGQLEFMDQNPASSPRWQAMLAINSDLMSLRPVGQPLGSTPSFAASSNLLGARAGEPITRTISASGGDGNLTLTVLGSNLLPGLTANITGPNLTISGNCSDGGENFLYLRVKDADGDAAWQVFRLYVGGGPGVILESNFDGTNPSMNLPWTPTYQVAPNWTTSGWTRGSGITPKPGDNALFWGQNMPADEASSTLAAALASNSTWDITISPGSGASPLDLRGAQVRFAINRIGYHSPRRFALFTNLSGFANGQQIFESQRISSTQTTVQMEVTLPTTSAFAAVNGPVTFRLVGYAGQYDHSHVVRLMEFRVTLDSYNRPPQLLQNPTLLPAAHPGIAYSNTLDSLASDPGDTLTWAKTSGPAWLSISSNGSVSGTPGAGDLGNSTFTATVTDSQGEFATLQFTIPVTQQVSAPNFSLASGSHPQGSTVSLSTSTPGASIRYTLNGTTPTSSVGTLYSGPVSLPLGTYVMKAVAYRSGFSDSAVSSASYEVFGTNPPVVNTHPQNQIVNAGGTAFFEVNADGSQPLNYQWRRNGIPLSGVNSSTLILSNVTPAQAGNYDVVVSNAYGNATSLPATLQVVASNSTNSPVLSLPVNRFQYVIPPYNLLSFLLTIENLGGTTLSWNATRAENGSSNYYAFRVNEPTTAGELDFQWRDLISSGSGGTRLTDLDSNNTTTVSLPWTFHFYGGNKTSAIISRFGTIQFTPGSVSGNNTGLPSTSAPADLIAACWDDWRFDSNSSAWVKGAADEYIVTWNNVYHSSNSTRRATFQAILFRDGRIRTQYLSTPASGISPTVGVQNAARTTGRLVTLNAPSEVSSGTAVTMGTRVAALSLSVGNGTVAPNSLSQVEFFYNTNNASEAIGTKRTTYIVLNSNDPNRPKEIIPITIEVASVPWMQVYGQLPSGSLRRIASGSATTSVNNLTLFSSTNQTNTYLVSNFTPSTVIHYSGNPKVQITGSHASDFAVAQDLPANSSLGSNFKIKFSPKGPGTRRAVVKIENSTAESPYHFVVEGPGIPWLDYWRAQFNLPSSGNGSLTSDPDGDGATNLLEYALGGNPLLNDVAGILPKPETVDNLLGITFRQYPDPALVYRVQFSQDLATWSDIWVSTGSQNQDIITTVLEPEPVTSSKRFLRLRINF